MLRRAIASAPSVLTRHVSVTKRRGEVGRIVAVARSSSEQQRRWMMAATSKQKRALSKQQLEGAKAPEQAKAPSKASRSPSPPKPSSGGGGGSGGGGFENTALLGFAGVAVAGVGAAAYWYNSEPSPVEPQVDLVSPAVEEEKKKEVEDETTTKKKNLTKEEVPPVQPVEEVTPVQPAEEEPVPTAEETKEAEAVKSEDVSPLKPVEESPPLLEEPPVLAAEETKEADTAKEEEVPPAKPAEESPVPAPEPQVLAAEETKQAETVKGHSPLPTTAVVDGGNRILNISIPKMHTPRPAPEPTPNSTNPHPENGHKVTLESMMKVEDKKEKDVKDNILALKEAIDQESSQTIKAAHKALSDALDTSVFQDLDDLSLTQLKIRIVQLAAEMKERTRWEAVRLKEFLAMKEKETAEKYLDALHKQRLEFENIMAQKLREQQAVMERATMNALQEKDDLIDKKLLETLAEQERELAEQKKTLEEIKDAALVEKEKEITLALDEKYSGIVEDIKKKKIEQMEEQNEKLVLLSEEISQLESSLKESQTYQSGSLKAHRVSAEALALADKLETNQGVGPELEALKMSVGDDSVIAAALSSIPGTIKSGIPTSAELRARFMDEIQTKCRQAAFVPEGMAGVEGQLLGKFFAAITIPPGPEEPIPTHGETDNISDYYLVRAREYVQLGQLEEAVGELKNLKGQALFTVDSWQRDAMDRAAVDKALKVIRMEAALLNKELSK